MFALRNSLGCVRRLGTLRRQMFRATAKLASLRKSGETVCAESDPTAQETSGPGALTHPNFLLDLRPSASGSPDNRVRLEGHHPFPGNNMRKVSTSFIGLTTALALTVVACGDDDLTGVDSGSELTSSEVVAILAVFGSAFESASSAAQAAPAQAPESVNETIDVTVPCESGSIAVSGSITGTADTETFISDLTTTVSWDPNACVVSDGTNTFTVDGDPRVELVLDLTTTQVALTFSGTETGGFSFTSSDGRSGSCALDVTFSIATSATGVERTVTGTICGLEADVFQTLGT